VTDSGRVRHYDLSGLGVRLHGAPRGWGSAVARWWAPFEVPRAARPVLEAWVRDDATAVGSGTPLACERVEEATDGSWVRFRTPEGEARVESSGRARIALGPGDEDVRAYALMNLLLAALAWRLPDLDTAVVHAAGVVVRGRAFVLVGAAGSGKSTFARCARDGGALSLSEDLVVLHAAGAGFEALSVPFRADDRRPAGPGRWPVAAVLLPEAGPEPGMRPADRMRARASLAANLPYAADSRRHGPALVTLMERLLAAVPVCTLTFRPDGSFLPLLAAFGEESR